MALKAVGSNPISHPKKRTKQSLRSFFIQSEGLACNLTAGEYVIRRFATAWHHATACISLRIDAIQPFGLIPYATLSRFHTADKLRIAFTRQRVFFDANSVWNFYFITPRLCYIRSQSFDLAKAHAYPLFVRYPRPCRRRMGARSMARYRGNLPAFLPYAKSLCI